MLFIIAIILVGKQRNPNLNVKLNVMKLKFILLVKDYSNHHTDYNNITLTGRNQMKHEFI